MAAESLQGNITPEVLRFEKPIPIRGYRFTLSSIKSAYRELQKLSHNEGERIINILTKTEGETDEAFAKRKAHVKEEAFRVTVSIIGFDGKLTYGEYETIFDSDDLSLPIRTIFFTNITAFRRNANGTEPPNSFSVTLHFDKPPLFDANAVLSDATPNDSNAMVHAEDIAYFRAASNIVESKLKPKSSGAHFYTRSLCTTWAFGSSHFPTRSTGPLYTWITCSPRGAHIRHFAFLFIFTSSVFPSSSIEF